MCDSDSGLEVLAVQRVSKAQAWQRSGRAGREDAGSCYRLYTEEEFDNLANMTVPEIQRCGAIIDPYIAVHTGRALASHLGKNKKLKSIFFT